MQVERKLEIKSADQCNVVGKIFAAAPRHRCSNDAAPRWIPYGVAAGTPRRRRGGENCPPILMVIFLLKLFITMVGQEINTEFGIVVYML